MDTAKTVGQNNKEVTPPRVSRYYSKVAGSKFVMPDGYEILFLHGFHDLKEEAFLGQVYFSKTEKGDPGRDGKPLFDIYKAELDALIKVGNPLLYVQGSQPEALPKPRDSRGREGTDVNALSEAQAASEGAAMIAAGARLSGDVNKGVTLDANASTVDNDLRGMVLKEVPQAKAIRDAAAQRTAASVPGGSASGN